DLPAHVLFAVPAPRDEPGVDVEPAAVAGLVHGLGADDVRADAVVEGQLLGRAPGVLQVVELAPLALAGIRARAHVAHHALHVAEHEAGQAQAAAARPGRVLLVEVQLAGAVRVAGHAQVVGASDVDAELDRVVAG